MLKHLPKDGLKKLEKTLLYRKQAVYFNQTTINRRIRDGSGFATRSLNATQIATAKKKKKNKTKDLDIDERMTKYKDQLKDEYVYRIPLKYFTDLEK